MPSELSEPRRSAEASSSGRASSEAGAQTIEGKMPGGLPKEMRQLRDISMTHSLSTLSFDQMRLASHFLKCKARIIVLMLSVPFWNNNIPTV